LTDQRIKSSYDGTFIEGFGIIRDALAKTIVITGRYHEFSVDSMRKMPIFEVIAPLT